ncbi:MAG: transcriptional regulator, TraR/DksA family [Betaproteobacteria bacterium]|jgi:DnaK suppressor protein|nr:transcriptional regulator, TraR/DksA family [Betaproteobacteria bacterium]
MANLTKSQLEKLKQKLLDRQRVLVGEVREKREQAATEGNEDAMGGVGDAGDESVLRMNTDLEIQEAGRDMEELNAIDAALRRMEDGSYGDCEACGQDIGFPRLEAQPTATRCIQDQEKFEKTFATRSTPTL